MAREFLIVAHQIKKIFRNFVFSCKLQTYYSISCSTSTIGFVSFMLDVVFLVRGGFEVGRFPKSTTQASPTEVAVGTDAIVLFRDEIEVGFVDFFGNGIVDMSLFAGGAATFFATKVKGAVLLFTEPAKSQLQ